MLDVLVTPAATLVAAAKATTSGGILDPIAKPIASILAAFYSLIPNYGIAILILSIVWMVLISPLTLKTTRSMLAMQKLQPQLKRLQEQHKNDRQAFAAAQMELFKEHNVSPFGSCLPSILPLPVFIALFRVIDGLSHLSKGVPTPKYLSPNTQMYKDIVADHGHLNAFGLDLAKNALTAHSSFFTAAPFYVLLLAMIGTQYYQQVQMMSRNPAAAQNPQMKMMKYLPLFFGIICIRFPAGVVLYYAMSNLCRITQQALMYRFDPKIKALVAEEVLEVEAKTRDIDETQAGRTKAVKPAPQPPRSRFRELLAGVAEQQQNRAEKPAPPTGKTPAGSNGAKNGARPTKAGAPPSRGGQPKARPGAPASAPNGVNKPAGATGKASGSATKPAAAAGKDQGPAKVAGAASKSAGTNGAPSKTGGSNGSRPSRSSAPSGPQDAPSPKPRAEAPQDAPNPPANGNGNGNGASAPPPSNRPRTGAGTGGRAGVSRTNRKRRAR